jgi:hypothetical protein
VSILNAPKPYIPESCHPRRSFSGSEPRSSFDYRRLKVSFMNRKTKSNGHILPRSRVLPCVQSHRQGDGSRPHQDRPYRDHCALPCAQPRSSPHPPSRVRWGLRSGQTSLNAALTHSIVFAIVFALLRRQFPQFY